MCKGILNLFLWGVLFVISSSQINAQVLLDKLLINNRSEKIKTSQVSEDVSERINRHQQEIFMLQSAGKSPGEIQQFINARLSKSGTGTISGTVYEKDGETLLPYIVAVYVYDLFGEYAGSMYTNDQGRYIINNLAAGNYYVRASARSYRTRYYDNADNLNSAVMVPVENFAETGNIDFWMQHCKGSISGYIRNEQGDPMSNCEIAALNTNSSSFGADISDSLGFYKIEFLETGYYKVRAFYEGTENYVAGWYGDVPGSYDGTSVYVNEPYNTDNIDLIMKLGGAVAGRVLKPDGQPTVPDWSAGYVVMVNEWDDYINLSERDSAGNYFIGRLPAGTYKMYTSYGGDENLVTTWYPGRSFPETAEIITISPPDTLYGMDFNFLSGGAVSGTLTAAEGDSVIGFAGVNLYDEYNNIVVSAMVENDSYLLSRIAPGNYKLYGYAQNLVPEWYDGKENFDDADLIEIRQNDTTRNINIVVDKGGMIAGIVKTVDGAPAEGQIGVFDMNYNYVASTNTNGTYLITGLRPGYYKVNYYYYGDKNYAEQWYNDKHSFEAADEVYAAPALTALTNFIVGYNGAIEGFVTDKDSNRVFVENSIMAVILYDAVTGELANSSASIGFTGAYRLKTFYNDYKMAVLLYHWNLFPAADSFAVSYYGGGSTFNDPASEVFTINGPGPVRLENVVMEKMPGAISGSVYVENEIYNRGDIELVCFDEYGYIVTANIYSNSLAPVDGTYKIHGLRPGTYYLTAGVYTRQPQYMMQYQWYGGMEAEMLNIEKTNIPPGAVPITVGDNEVSGKDFHFGAFTGMNEKSTQEFTFRLEQNYPNPFNPVTKIMYTIPQQGKAVLKIYDMLGREITTLVNEEKPAGNYEITWNAYNLSSGVYFCRLTAGEYVDTKKMLLLK